MKKYLVQKTFEVEPMLQYEAEARLGHEINNPSKEYMGVLTCDTETLKWDWVPETHFRGKPCETPLDNAFLFRDFITQWQTFFRKYPKIKEHLSQNERLQVYQINRHLKAIDTAIQKILNLNIINNTIEL